MDPPWPKSSEEIREQVTDLTQSHCWTGTGECYDHPAVLQHSHTNWPLVNGKGHPAVLQHFHIATTTAQCLIANLSIWTLSIFKHAPNQNPNQTRIMIGTPTWDPQSLPSDAKEARTKCWKAFRTPHSHNPQSRRPLGRLPPWRGCETYPSIKTAFVLKYLNDSPPLWFD